MKPILIGAALALLGFAQATPTSVKNPAFRALVREAQAHVKRVNIQQYRELRQAHPDVVLIDVRETEEWSRGHAAGAVHISRGLLERDIEEKVPDNLAAIVVYCHSGARSALAAESLMKMGYANVHSLDGGITAYEAAGLPMVK